MLSVEQEEHVNQVTHLLKEYAMAFDTSSTGAGKTYCSLEVAKRLRWPTLVLVPATLKETWESYSKERGVPLTIISHHHSVIERAQVDRETLIIIDECQSFKNPSLCSKALEKLVARAHGTLFLSATPYDHPRQQGQLQRYAAAARYQGDIWALFSRIYFQHKTRVNCSFYHPRLGKGDDNEYRMGRSKIAQAGWMTPLDVPGAFDGALFMMGLRALHGALLMGFLRCVRERVKKCPKHKFILVVKFKDHVGAVLKKWPRTLVLNGSTPIGERARVVAKFQRPNLDYNMICISDTVGGVGVDLDDQDGNFPREIISLPIFLSDFIQVVGRVQRRNTKSDARVWLVERAHENYFSRQLQMKLAPLELCGREPIVFEYSGEHDPRCHLGFSTGIRAIDEIIREYTCECFVPSARVQQT